MSSLYRLLPGVVMLLVAACGDAPPADTTSSAASSERPGLVYTDFTRTHELFVEFPALVAGQPSTFIAHVTRLSDYRPLTAGTMDVLLEADGSTVARFRVTEPARTGIFLPRVVPRDTGTFDLVIEVTDGDRRTRHELGEVTVFADSGSVTINQVEREGDIGYLKEQQWSNPFATHSVGRRPLRPSVPGFALVKAPADAGAEIRAPVDGYFSSASLAGAGDSVSANDVLGYLVPRLGDGADLGDLQVALERARSRMTLAEQDIERLEPLVEQGAVPERRLTEARQTLSVARTELDTARSRIEQYQSGNAEAGIALRTPVAGEVIAVNAEPGSFVRSGDQVFRVASPTRRWLEVRVPEHLAGNIGQASGVWFQQGSDAATVLDSESGARLVRTETAIEPTTRTAGVTIEYPTAQGPALIGSRFSAHVFTQPPRSRLAIPRSAVIEDNGLSVVYVQTGGEMFVRRPVELGIVDGNFVEVLNGVSEGERIVSTGAYYVRLAASSGGDEIGHGHAH